MRTSRRDAGVSYRVHLAPPRVISSSTSPLFSPPVPRATLQLPSPLLLFASDLVYSRRYNCGVCRAPFLAGVFDVTDMIFDRKQLRGERLNYRDVVQMTDAVCLLDSVKPSAVEFQTVVDAKIGGAVLCWGPLDGTPELSQWDWLTSLIDACTHIQRSPSNPKGSNALDFVDFHACACHDQRPSPLTLISPPALVFLVPLTQFLPLAADGNGEENGNRVLSEIHMVAAYSDARHALHMPSAITETSVALASRANWTNRSFHFGHRTLPRLRQIMAVLAHPDKMLLVQEHDLSADAGGQFSFIGSSHNLSSMSNATPEMEMFRALKPLRGTRLDRDLLGLQDATMDAAAEVVWNGACFGIGRWYRQRLTPRSNRPVFPFC